MPTATPFNNLITFSRGSNATVTGSNGLIQWAPNNLLLQSESFDNATWQKFGGGVATAPAVTANAGVAPDGTTTADRVQFTLNGGTTSTDRSLLSQSATLATSFPYTYSIWVRSLTGTLSMGIGCDNLVGNTPITVTTEWQRFTVSGTATGTAGVALLQLRGGQTPVQSNAADVLIWGAQLEIGSTATTYNPTTVKNLLGFSEAFDNAAWTKTSARIITGAAANPINGLFNAQKLMEDTANTLHFTFQSTVVIANTRYVQSVYAKAAERNWIWMTEGNNVTAQAYFDLANGVIGTVTGTGSPSATITPVGNGWYRCSLAFTPIAAFANTQVRLATANGGAAYAGDGNSGVYIYGAQLSDSASLDPYVPTPGAAPSSTAFYGPRFDFDPVTLQPRGLLVEEQRTNLATYSNTFSDASWTAFGTKNLVANSTVSPDGEVNASTLTDNSAAAFQGMGKTVTVANDNATYTASIYVRKTTGGTSATFGVNLQLTGGTLVTAQPRLNTDTGALINGTGTVQNAGAYWRLTTTVTNNTTGNTTLALAVYPATAAYNSGTDSAAATGSAIIYGAQLEAGAFATSYIPTVASTVTRSADVATITGQNFAQWYSQPQGSFVAEFRPTIAGSYTVYAATDGTTNNRVQGPASDVAQFLVVTGGATQALLDGGTIPPAAVSKIASAYAANDFALTLNAGTVATDTTGTPPVVDRFSVASLIGNQEFLNGHIRNIRFIPARAADFQLQGLST